MKPYLAKSNKKITILLTSAGGLTGIFLSKHFKKTSDYRIVGVDMSDINPLKEWVDVFYKVPAIKANDFLLTIKNIIFKEKVDVVIPVSSYDVDFFSKATVQVQLADVKLLTMDYDDHIKLHDKKECYQFLNKIGVVTPLIYSKKDEIQYPCVIKPKRSSGSRNTEILYDEIDFEYWSKKSVDNIVIQYLEGKEYTVDCLFDKCGKCLGANVRERVKMRGGGATISRIDNTIMVDDIIKKLEKLGTIKGPVNFQFKRLSDGQLCVFDFNTRFASGGLALTVESGFDIPNLLVEMLLGESNKKFESNPENNGLTMVRYYEEYFMYDYE